jgi:uncharacterized protein
MFSWRKNDAVARMVEEYLQKAEECLSLMQETFEIYFEKGLGGAFDEGVEKTHMAESSCDDICQQIEAAMYEKSLIPESREDILNLLETLDRIPNQAESALFHVQMQLLGIPEEFVDKFRQLVHVNRDAFVRLTEAVRALFAEPKKVRAGIREVDKEESSSDHLERDMIRSFFTSETLPPDQKILLKELVIQIGKVANRCENAGDRLHIITVKRLV